MHQKRERKVIGRLEYVDIPDLDLKQVTAKIDTGAYRGSIHANQIEEIEEDGVKKLQFHIIDDFHPELNKKVHKVTKYSVKRFRGTEVDLHDRFVIPLTIKIAGEEIVAELSLSDRSALRFPILIGRRPIKRGRFLIDVRRRYCNTPERKSKTVIL